MSALVQVAQEKEKRSKADCNAVADVANSSQTIQCSHGRA